MGWHAAVRRLVASTLPAARGAPGLAVDVALRRFPRPHLPRPQVLVGNKSDMDESKRAVAYSRGQALADEFRMQFFETSAKNNTNVDEVFQVGARGEGVLCRWSNLVVPVLAAMDGCSCPCMGRARALPLPGSARLAGLPPTSPWLLCRVQSVARDIMLRLKDTQPDAGSGAGSGPSLRVGAGQRKAVASSKGGCC